MIYYQRSNRDLVYKIAEEVPLPRYLYRYNYNRVKISMCAYFRIIPKIYRLHFISHIATVLVIRGDTISIRGGAPYSRM